MSNFPSGKPSLIYWAISGRADFAKLMMHAGNVEFDLDTENANSWPAYKPETPFGQIPVLKHGDLTFGQGGAINRYCARLAGLYPDDPVEASKCDMIMEECMDIFSALFKCKNLSDPNAMDKEAKLAAWKNIKGNHLPTHFGFLQKILKDSGKPYFGGDKPNAADVAFYAVYGIYDAAKCGADEVLGSFPELANVVHAVNGMGNIPSVPKEPPFFTADPEHANF